MKIIIDCDPGIDDALAIAMALQNPQIEILGITTVCGNFDLNRTTANALKTLDYFGRLDIPVYSGSEKPLSGERYVPESDSSHGYDGLGNSNFPQSKTPASNDAVGFMKKAANMYPGDITILAIGPLTNIAKLLDRIEPASIGKLYVMGGAFFAPGNVTEYAEFNAFCDPQAAKRVYESGVPTKVVGLDATNQVSITKKEFEDIEKINTRQAKFFTSISRWAIERNVRERYAIFWDPVALVWMMKDNFIQARKGQILVETEGKYRGRTKFIECAGNVEIGLKADPKIFFEKFYRFLNTK